MTDNYVIFWEVTPVFGNGREHEAFETLEAAQEQLREWAERYPWNRYVLAKIVGEQLPTAERPRDPYFGGVGFVDGVKGSVATCEAVVQDGTITAVTLTAPSR